jgi:restriction system protein
MMVNMKQEVMGTTSLLGIDELIVFDVESTAYWRRQTSERFPEDHRNIEAAEILERLALEVRALAGSAVHERLARLAQEDVDGNFSNILSELLRAIGFRSFPSSGEAFVDELVLNLELLPSLKGLRSISHISDLLIQSVVTVGKKTDEGRLIESVAIPWFDIIAILKDDPRAAYQIPAEKWEEIIAGSYRRAGFDHVILTPRSGDKGRDVIATIHGVGSVRVIDQVKAYKPDHLVTANDVRALFGVLIADGDGASKGFLTTTSDFAPRLQTDILLAPLIPSRIELINGKKLLARLQSLARKS